MKSITWQEIEQIAEAGDVLYGDFECLNWIWDNEKKDYQKVIEKTNKLVFWECISCLTDKEDVRKGAKIFEHNGKMYEIEIMRPLTANQGFMARELTAMIEKHCDEKAKEKVVDKLNELLYAIIKGE